MLEEKIGPEKPVHAQREPKLPGDIAKSWSDNHMEKVV